MAAMCVQDVDVQGVLQFTLILAFGCALHRHTSRVIHHSKSVVLTPVPQRKVSMTYTEHISCRSLRHAKRPLLKLNTVWWRKIKFSLNLVHNICTFVRYHCFCILFICFRVTVNPVVRRNVAYRTKAVHNVFFEPCTGNCTIAVMPTIRKDSRTHNH